MAGKSTNLSKWLQGLNKDVEDIQVAEAKGEKEAFADWLHTLYMGGFDGDKLADFEEFKTSPLVLDMIADWHYECKNQKDRIDLLDHIHSRYAAEDFDEPEHFDKEGNPILCNAGDQHFDSNGKPLTPYVLVLDRKES